MNTKSLWIQDPKLPSFPKLEANLSVDVIIIGGGITGITAAYLLKRAGLSVALLERNKCSRAETGHTTAHLTQVTDLRLHRLVERFGEDHGSAVWDAGRAAIDLIHANLNRENIDCDFSWVPAYLFESLTGKSSKEAENLKKDTQLADHFEFDAQYLDSVPIFERPGNNFANQAKFHPVKYLAGLLKTIPGNGSHVFENTEVNEFLDDPLKIMANGHSIQGNYVVIATHMPLLGNRNTLLATLFQTKLAAYSTYAIGLKLPKGKYSEALYWDTSDPYYYLRIDRGDAFDYAIFGGEDHKTGQAVHTDSLFEKLFSTLKPHLPDAEMDLGWSGQIINTNDGLPLIGEIADRQFVATGFSGNGMTFGTLSGLMACDAALGKKNPWKSLFDVHRKNIFGGTWNYLKENKDYPYYLIKDRIAANEIRSIESVKPGEGVVTKIDGERFAIYRDLNGKVTALTAVCPHMGCIVHWNSAETTWDCPCHGSRFKTNGEVIAGPAESPLEKKVQMKNLIQKRKTLNT